MNAKNSSKEEGFGLGLFVGMVTGVAAYYFFGTDKGQELKKKLSQEFNAAKQELPPKLITITESITHEIEESSSTKLSLLENLKNLFKPSSKSETNSAPTPKKKRTFTSSKTP